MSIFLKSSFFKKLFKYFLGGLSNTLLSYVLYCVFLLILNYKISYFLSSFISIIYISQINRKLIFNVNSNLKNNIAFTILSSTQLFSGLILIELMIETYKVNQLIAPFINIITISPIFFLFNYFTSKRILKNKPSQ